MYRRQSRSKVAQVHDTGTVRTISTYSTWPQTSPWRLPLLTSKTTAHLTVFALFDQDAGMYQTIRSTPPYYSYWHLAPSSSPSSPAKMVALSPVHPDLFSSVSDLFRFQLSSA
ncbi:hypothetical protein F2Q69_00032669 [Brassica cretica]|uniref:Uncharacterized protein n=1 Tax=Brassica cretica TaxID=69181 RepID=A0A8S9STB1_BRACR|nr:hypothetical protein F2Q69_00032669 [Brassica cretica]